MFIPNITLKATPPTFMFVFIEKKNNTVKITQEYET